MCLPACVSRPFLVKVMLFRMPHWYASHLYVQGRRSLFSVRVCEGTGIERERESVVQTVTRAPLCGLSPLVKIRKYSSVFKNTNDEVHLFLTSMHCMLCSETKCKFKHLQNN